MLFQFFKQLNFVSMTLYMYAAKLSTSSFFCLSLKQTILTISYENIKKSGKVSPPNPDWWKKWSV